MLAEYGTHALMAAEVAAWPTGEKTLAKRLYPRLRPDELRTADRDLYRFGAWSLTTGSGAALLSMSLQLGKRRCTRSEVYQDRPA